MVRQLSRVPDDSVARSTHARLRRTLSAPFVAQHPQIVAAFTKSVPTHLGPLGETCLPFLFLLCPCWRAHTPGSQNSWHHTSRHTDAWRPPPSTLNPEPLTREHKP